MLRSLKHWNRVELPKRAVRGEDQAGDPAFAGPGTLSVSTERPDPANPEGVFGGSGRAIAKHRAGNYV